MRARGGGMYLAHGGDVDVDQGVDELKRKRNNNTINTEPQQHRAELLCYSSVLLMYSHLNKGQ